MRVQQVMSMMMAQWAAAVQVVLLNLALPQQQQ
jgi:hypothetical protein